MLRSGMKNKSHSTLRLPSPVSPDGAEDPLYASDDINDFTLFRHIGVFEISDKPVFDGFYVEGASGSG